MKTKRFCIALMIIVMVMTLVACGSKEEVSESYGVTATGTIKRAETTTYMYGTHILVDANGKTLYALKSDKIDLDEYAEVTNVTVKGDLISGYPVKGGPEYLEVKKVE